jgi:hypothetical protein
MYRCRFFARHYEAKRGETIATHDAKVLRKSSCTSGTGNVFKKKGIKKESKKQEFKKELKIGWERKMIGGV